MATNFPGAVDNFPRPNSTTNTDDPGYELDNVIDNLSDGLEAVEKFNRNFMGPSLPLSFYGAWFPTNNAIGGVLNAGGAAAGTSRVVPTGVPVSGIFFSITTATVTGTTLSVATYECDEIGQPTTRVNLTSGIALTAGWKTVSFTHTPVGGILWAFFALSQADSTVRIGGFNNNSGDYLGVPRYTGNLEAQRCTYINDSLPSTATGFGVSTDWSSQPGFYVTYNGVRP